MNNIEMSDEQIEFLFEVLNRVKGEDENKISEFIDHVIDQLEKKELDEMCESTEAGEKLDLNQMLAESMLNLHELTQQRERRSINWEAVKAVGIWVIVVIQAVMLYWMM